MRGGAGGGGLAEAEAAADAGTLDPAGVAGAAGPGSLVPFPQPAAARRRRPGLVWDRWRRLPAAEAELLAAYEAAGRPGS